jgi:hypothetical protein
MSLLDRIQEETFKRERPRRWLAKHGLEVAAFRPVRRRTLFEFEDPNPEISRMIGLPIEEQIAHGFMPAHIGDELIRARDLAGPFEPRAAKGWQATINRIAADGAAITNTTTETIMVPDFTIAPGFIDGGKQLKWVLWGRVSTVVTTPGTITFKTRFGGVGGTTIMTSKAQRPKTTVSTNMAGYIEMLTMFRRPGNAQLSGVALGMGQNLLGNSIGDAAAVGESIWPDAPAEVTSALNTDAGGALSPTITFSVATATTAWTTHIARLEDLT